MSPVSMQTLTVSLVQGATRWHDAPANREYYGALVRQARGSDLVVLPETFLSGWTVYLDTNGELVAALSAATA